MVHTLVSECFATLLLWNFKSRSATSANVAYPASCRYFLVSKENVHVYTRTFQYATPPVVRGVRVCFLPCQPADAAVSSIRRRDTDGIDRWKEVSGESPTMSVLK